MSPGIMKCIFPDTTNPYNLRNNNPFKGSNVHTVYNGTETISFRGSKTWAHLSHYMNLNLKLNNGNHQGAHADFAMYM